MTGTRVPAALSYLVSTFRAAATLGQATPPVDVIDGPKVTADPGQLALWVGVDDIDPANAPSLAASSQQQWTPGLGRNGRTETLSIPCTVQVWSGGDDIPSLRATAAGIVSAAETLVRSDPSLGGTLPGSHDAAVTSADWRQGPTGRGMAVRVTFTIDATALI